MKRILLNAAQASNRSGTGRYVTELMQALQQLKLPVEIVAVDHRGRLSFLPQHDVHDTTALQKLFQEQVRIPCASWRYDLTHYPAGMGPLLPCRKLILTVHDLVALRHPEWFTRNRAAYYRHASRTGVRQARRIIADSEATRQDLQDLLRVHPDKIDVVPLGVSPTFRPATADEIEAARQKLNLPEKYFLFMGTIEPRKNLPRVVAAWRSIADQVPENLVIAGRPGWHCQELLADCRQGQHARRIHVLGPVLDPLLSPLLSAATAFVWPSLYEGFGLPPLEAIACGTPVISSNTSSIPEVVGDAGLLVDPENVEAIADAMLRISAEDELRQKLSALGKTRAAQFTWQRTAERTAAAYLRAME